jgi:hypothetical protein
MAHALLVSCELRPEPITANDVENDLLAGFDEEPDDLTSISCP